MSLLLNIFLTTAIWLFIIAHKIAVYAIVNWMFSAYASQLKAPLPMGNRWYAWWYGFVHLAAANLDRLRARA